MSQLAPSGPRIEYGPHPRDYMQIREGAPFVVPPGRVFIPTALGVPGLGQIAGIMRVNGVEEIRAEGAGWGDEEMVALPRGGTFAAGSLIEVSEQTPSALDAVAWGYLASDQPIAGTVAPAIRVRFEAPARDNVIINAGSPYVVPAGRILTFTAAGLFSVVSADGVVLFRGVSPGNDTRIGPVPEGCTARGGATITITAPGGIYPGRAWGFLVSQ